MAFAFTCCSFRFHSSMQLDRELKWHGSTLALKVPVINLKVFPEDVRCVLSAAVSDTPSLRSSDAGAHPSSFFACDLNVYVHTFCISTLLSKGSSLSSILTSFGQFAAMQSYTDFAK